MESLSSETNNQFVSSTLPQDNCLIATVFCNGCKGHGQNLTNVNQNLPSTPI